SGPSDDRSTEDKDCVLCALASRAHRWLSVREGTRFSHRRVYTRAPGEVVFSRRFARADLRTFGLAKRRKNTRTSMEATSPLSSPVPLRPYFERRSALAC